MPAVKFDFHNTGNALLDHILAKRGANGIVSVYRDRKWTATLVDDTGSPIREACAPDYETALENVLGEITDQDLDGFEQ